MTETFDILVLGAGQAGLAVGYFLQQRGVSFLLVDRQTRVGDSWRERYDSLVLFSSRAYSALPDLALTGDPAGYPDKNEIADYLEHYARMMRLPIRMNQSIRALERDGGLFRCLTSDGAMLSAASVIIATGPFQQTIVPRFAARLSADVTQFTGATYREPAQLPRGRVLIVGDGATGRQVAAELAGTHAVWMAGGKFRVIVPQRFLGRDIIAWFDTTGALRADKESLHGRFVHLFDPIPGWNLRRAALRRLGVKIVRRAVDAEGKCLQFADGTSDSFDAVIWAIGYHDDASWIRIPEAIDAHGRYIEARGVSPVPGLFHIGRNWQNNRASALLAGVGNDAADIADKAVSFVGSNNANAIS